MSKPELESNAPAGTETLRAESVSKTGIDYPALLNFVDTGVWTPCPDLSDAEILYYSRPAAGAETEGMIAAIELGDGDLLNVVIAPDREEREPQTEADLEDSFKTQVSGHVFVAYLAEFWADEDLRQFRAPQPAADISIAA